MLSVNRSCEDRFHLLHLLLIEALLIETLLVIALVDNN